ncbi:beta-fructofuranosidase, insoluble isoenzyme 3-like [Typha angustifolia]|uniref:beta-fructofuranosidase, insoluble isoenzyme 3-like n=1 Tax=Typha angustifolia TaxID=59011 RepID=UPI003C300024
METSQRIFAMLVVIFLLHLSGIVKASHMVYSELQSTSPDIVDSKLRTGYHFQPPMHWINDPNGPMYYKGLYHLFYQYNPKGAVWGNIVWAHSVSTDMINWVALEPAIYPTKPFDIEGCWSGSATILSDGTPTIMYTGIDSDNHQVQNIAFPANSSDPYLREWIKPDYNPIIAPTFRVNASAFRDPTTAWLGSDDYWRVAVGSKWNKRGKVILYRSKDLKNWIKAKHPLHSAPETGMWECPDFFPVAKEGKLGLDTSMYGHGMRHVLKVSLDLTRFEYYTIGTYYRKIDRYVPDAMSVDNSMGLRYDYGNFYASKTFYDADKKRRILWGWSNESDSVNADQTKGWSGIQTVPRTIWLDPSGKQLLQWPIEELGSLRGNQVNLNDKVVKGGDYFEVKGIQTAQADVEVEFDVASLERAEPFDTAYIGDAQALCKIKGADVKGGVGPFGLWVLASSKLQERTAVFFRVFKNGEKHVVLMCQDPTRSSFGQKLFKPTFAGFVDLDIKKTKKIYLRSLIDNSVVESFGEKGKTCITSRVYPTLAIGSNAHLYVFNNGEQDIKVSNLEAWEMTKADMNGA